MKMTCERFRSRLDPSLAGPSSIFIRLRKVQASDLISSLTVNDVVHSDPDSMLGAASDYFERVYEDRPIDDAALKAIIDGLASTRLSPADSLKLEEAYPLEEMTKAQAACKSNSSPGPDGLPVEFYRATWPATGPILRDVINSIPTEARQPGPLPRNTAHIHLIHKRGERDQLSNKRPISLINADKRIISQAHNQRLAPLLESLIGPTQRGFVPNHWIGTNIAEVQCLMDPGLPGSTPVSGMLAVMDFEKAYDRLSHPYLDAVLCAVGLGPKARQWYRATYTNQSASIFLNGWLSATFDILSGVRQGDPLAPSLFVLAIEGFACQIRLRVKGIDIAGLQNVRELLFADDACCALHNLSDLDHLNRAIELYERASASKLSNIKSFLYPLGAFRDRSIAPDLGIWRLSDSQFRYLGIQVGVEIAEDAGWEDVKASTIARIRSIPMYDLPYAAKCSIINIYCYTKILYYSRFLPAPKSVVKEIEEAAMLTIHGRASDGTQQRPKVSRSRLCTPLDHGGFGLIDLPRRLAIDHAKWVFQLRAPDGCFTCHLFDIRIRLQAPNEPTPFTLSRPAPNQHRCPWIWIWWAYFCHPPPKWDHAVRKTTKLLPARWVRYFEAWALVTTLNPPELSKSQNLEQWATHVLYFPAGHGIQLSVNPTLFRGPDGEVMTPSSFVNASKRHQVFIFPPIFPKGHQKVFDLPEQRWNAWWKALRKVRRVHSDAEDTGHLLSLGSLHPGSQVASPTSPHPNNRSTSCVMCLSEAPECLVHLAVGCPFARRLWSALSPTPHPVFVDFVCPVVSRSERRLVELRVLFFHSIWKLCCRRRFSSDLLEPITKTEFEGLRASIQESKGRLVSLPTLLASASTWLETLHSFTVDHPVLPSAVTLNDPDRTLVELHLQRAGYCTACNCIQIEVSPRRPFVVDWPCLRIRWKQAKNSGRRHHKRNCPGGSYVQFVSITSLPRVILININNIYPDHSLAPAELRFGVSDQMPEMVWRLRSGVYNINNSHFVPNATVGYGQEAACYHFDPIKGSLARPIGDRNAGGLVSVLFYELEEESLNFLQAFNLMLTRQWHEMWSLYHEPSDPTDIGIKVSSLPPKGTLEEGQGVWKMEDASAFFHECEICSWRKSQWGTFMLMASLTHKVVP
ncbi:BQ5605_C011g06387 [Microbotryum silenes-dioicae]|uniref:BQ5605_C011g06387 protein n=1 Tax=Microbotryum silenes-dioicae TaxID=796604 RepID=A0A2X0MHV7_9BASI|nr:BQ5605_C011g06387 [Microbotryum silenes-dioicae]